jgi:hypothetical protein
MEEGEKKPDAGTTSGDPQKKIVYAVIAIAVVILAVVLIAKFGYNTDLLNPAGGQMSLVQRQVTLVRPNITISEQQPRLTVTTPAFQRVTTGIVRLSPCTVNQSTDCNGACVYLTTDSKNCGTCGFSCSGALCGAHSCNTCDNGNCIYDNTCEGVVCSVGYSCCKGRCVSNEAPNCGY